LFVPLSGSDITDLEINCVLEVLNSGRLALGPYLDKFETIMKEYVNSTYAVAVNSGTSALHLILRSLGFERGDKMIVTPFTFISSANVSLFEQGKPIFIDIDYKTYNMSTKNLKLFFEEEYNRDVSYFMGVDIFGVPLDWDNIYEILPEEVKIIEDSCEALGGEYKDQKLGTFGDAGAFAFYPNKQITTGEGGIIVTDHEEIYDLCKSMSNQGRGKNGEWLISERLGYNYRMDEMSAALGYAQMKRINEISDKRKQKADNYFELFRNDRRIVLPFIPQEVTQESWFVFVLRLNLEWLSQYLKIPKWVQNFDIPIKIEGEKNQKEWNLLIKQLRSVLNNLLKKLNDKGVQSKNYFYPIHLQPFYKKLFGYVEGDFPITELISSLTFAIPFFNNITFEQQTYVYKIISESLEEIKDEASI
jgi:dTDP-4-amino-4,6-dideoxygalactose transaminase